MNRTRTAGFSSLALAGFLGLVGLAACTTPASPTEPTAENFTAAMNTYLAQRGDLCLGKNQWPIDVTEREEQAPSRNAVQMPVLQKLGLVTVSDAEVDLKDEDGVSHLTKVHRYALTEAGSKYVVVRDTLHPDGTRASEGNFCAAKLSLDKVVRWSDDAAVKMVAAAAAASAPTARQMVVTYTYKIQPAPWMSDPDAQKVFPMVAGVVHGAGTAELTETFRQTDAGWVAVDL